MMKLRLKEPFHQGMTVAVVVAVAAVVVVIVSAILVCSSRESEEELIRLRENILNCSAALGCSYARGCYNDYSRT